MKNITIIAVIAVILLAGCDLFKSKKEKLCNQEWVLWYFRKDISKDSTYSKFYTKNDSKGKILFFENSDCKYTDTSGITHDAIWTIYKKKLIIDYDNEPKEYDIIFLDDDNEILLYTYLLSEGKIKMTMYNYMSKNKLDKLGKK